MNHNTDLFEMAKRGTAQLERFDEDAIHVVTVDYNDVLSDISAALGLLHFVRGVDEGSARTTKCMIETVFYLGYLAGKNTPDVSLWEDQL